MRAARAFEQAAVEVRLLGHRLGAVRQVPWRSAAADAFRHEVVEEAVRLEVTARVLEAAAAAWDEHARDVAGRRLWLPPLPGVGR